MNRQRTRRSPGGAHVARDIRPPRASSPPTRRDHRRLASAPVDAAALALLSEILVGDSAWTMAEVQRLISMREVAELGRWRVDGPDDEGTSAG